MATKSYSKHKEYKEYSSTGTMPYTGEQLDMIKSDLLPKGSKLDSLGRNGGGGGTREYHYEYKEEKLPGGGKYDRKDFHTVEEYTIPSKTKPKSSESSSYYYEREERALPTVTGTRTYNYESAGSSPGYSKVKSSKVTKEMTQNVEELDSLLDDLQRDQERQLYKSGYASDTAESTSFDYRRGTPAKAPSSGYSTLKHEERVESSSWGTSSPPPPPPAVRSELRQELYREEKTESRVVPSQVSVAPPAPPAPLCTHCHHAPTATLSRSSTPMNKVTTTVKTYTYEVPADQDPASVPIPLVADHQHTYVTEEHHNSSTTNTLSKPVSPSPGCQYCSHCNTRLREVLTHTTDHTNERIVYPPTDNKLHPEPHNGHGPYGPTTYKYSETSYSSQNSSQRFPVPPPAGRSLTPSPSPFPRPVTPTSPVNQQTPKKLDDLLADFPEARFPTQPDGLTQRKVEVSRETSSQVQSNQAKSPPIGSSKNVAGPAVYYPPGHTPFATTPYQASSAAMQQGGGAYASGRAMYEYESGAKSREKRSEKKTAVPVCLPLCCAMPCVIM